MWSLVSHHGLRYGVLHNMLLKSRECHSLWILVNWTHIWIDKFIEIWKIIVEIILIHMVSLYYWWARCHEILIWHECRVPAKIPIPGLWLDKAYTDVVRPGDPIKVLLRNYIDKCFEIWILIWIFVLVLLRFIHRYYICWASFLSYCVLPHIFF